VPGSTPGKTATDQTPQFTPNASYNPNTGQWTDPGDATYNDAIASYAQAQGQYSYDDAVWQQQDTQIMQQYQQEYAAWEAAQGAAYTAYEQQVTALLNSYYNDFSLYYLWLIGIPIPMPPDIPPPPPPIIPPEPQPPQPPDPTQYESTSCSTGLAPSN